MFTYDGGINNIRAAISIFESAFIIETENELVEKFPFERNCRFKYCHKHKGMWHIDSVVAGFLTADREVPSLKTTQAFREFLCEQEMNPRETPPDQVVNWYPKRTVSIQV